MGPLDSAAEELHLEGLPAAERRSLHLFLTVEALNALLKSSEEGSSPPSPGGTPAGAPGGPPQISTPAAAQQFVPPP